MVSRAMSVAIVAVTDMANDESVCLLLLGSKRTSAILHLGNQSWTVHCAFDIS